MLGNALEQALVMLPLVLGIYLSYRILRVTDLTVDGSFVLGAAMYARLLSQGASQGAAVMAALLSGALAGVIVSLIQRRGRIDSLVASVIMLFMLYTVNFQVMGKPNLNLLGYDLLEGVDMAYHPLIKLGLLSAFGLVLGGGLYLLLKTRTGLLLRAYGTSPQLLGAFGKNAEAYRTGGLALSNLLAALCGVMTAQLSGYADINMGFGMALTGIGAVVIGQQLFKSLGLLPSFRPLMELISCFVGIYLYFVLVHVLLACHINPINLKLCLGIVLIVALRSSAALKGGRS